MELSKQVITLEQAKRLKELGVDQSSIWMWVFPANEHMISSNKGLHYHELAKEIIEGNEGDEFDHESVAAFTVAELGQMIGKGTKAGEAHWQWLLECVNSGLSGTVAYNPVALAGFVITQIEIGNLSPEECNKRLSQS